MGLPRRALLSGATLASLWLILTPGCGQEILTWDAGSNPEDAGTDGGVDAGPALVISELAGAGSGGLTDEFVEVYNRSGTAVSLSGWTLEYRSAGGSQQVYHEFDSADSVAPRGFYLVGHGDFTGNPDDRLTKDSSPQMGVTMSASSGTLFLLDSASATVDQVGWGSGAAEGGASTVGVSGTESVERKANASSTAASMTTGADVSAGNGHDTNNNQQDFVLRATRDPQNATAPAEP